MHSCLFTLSLDGPSGQYGVSSYDQISHSAHSLKCILSGPPQQAVSPCLGSDGVYTPWISFILSDWVAFGELVLRVFLPLIFQALLSVVFSVRDLGESKVKYCV